ncbi:hypothetical protein BUALT_Bualt02G0017200 [Buddleja alternifolia]|uniref:TATA-box binding protein n=1 Tax=Buddleja alternifolia TaxID=168488 RepID=A0AAV6XWI4_9LAMI|nr:hypothetical protein BUALT_Bualt02G0017200 [Buddleja alternifolia]
MQENSLWKELVFWSLRTLLLGCPISQKDSLLQFPASQVRNVSNINYVGDFMGLELSSWNVGTYFLQISPQYCYRYSENSNPLLYCKSGTFSPKSAYAISIQHRLFLPSVNIGKKVAIIGQSRGWVDQLKTVLFDGRSSRNIVSTVNLDCKLDLKAIALQARNAEYNPKRFAAVIMRIREPKTTALIFASGKMVCTGAKSEQQSKLAARKYARIIQKLGFPAKFKDFKIQNIVGSCDVKFPIRLEGLAYAHGAFSSYEPELFPGLIYRMKQPKIVLLIFVSGKIVLTGAKVREETYTAFENIYPVLTEFRKVQQWYETMVVYVLCIHS